MSTFFLIAFAVLQILHITACRVTCQKLHRHDHWIIEAPSLSLHCELGCLTSSQEHPWSSLARLMTVCIATYVLLCHGNNTTMFWLVGLRQHNRAYLKQKHGDLEEYLGIFTLWAPDGLHVGPMNLVIRVATKFYQWLGLLVYMNLVFA